MNDNILDKFREIQNLTSWDAYQVSCHLFKEKDDVFESFGSGVFIKIKENHFLSTVAHVAEGLDFGLFVGIEKNTMFKLGGNLVTNNTENRNDDKLDICVLKLCVNYKSKKPLKIKRLTTVIVPLTIPFSNSFYQNLTDIYALKELLYNEGIADYNGLPLVKPNQSNTLLLPNGY
jgi:hypothetical protein